MVKVSVHFFAILVFNGTSNKSIDLCFFACDLLLRFSCHLVCCFSVPIVFVYTSFGHFDKKWILGSSVFGFMRRVLNKTRIH